MPSQRPKIVVYSDEETISKIQHIAQLDRRKVSNYCDLLIQDHIKTYEAEHGEIQLKGGME